jgi:hypothetical protein
MHGQFQERHTGLAVITGTEDRQHVYIALTRGTDANHAYVFTASPNRADLVPGPRPAPELARYDTISAERAGDPAPATAPATAGTAPGVLAVVLERDGQQQSATQTRNQALADADHLAIPHAIWTAETSSPASSATGTCSRPPCRLAATPSPRPGTGGCGGPCTPPNSPDWPRPGPRRCGRRTGSRWCPPRHGSHRRPHPQPDRLLGPAPTRAVVRARPRHRRPRTPRLPH